MPDGTQTNQIMTILEKAIDGNGAGCVQTVEFSYQSLFSFMPAQPRRTVPFQILDDSDDLLLQGLDPDSGEIELFRVSLMSDGRIDDTADGLEREKLQEMIFEQNRRRIEEDGRNSHILILKFSFYFREQVEAFFRSFYAKEIIDLDCFCTAEGKSDRERGHKREVLVAEIPERKMNAVLDWIIEHRSMCSILGSPHMIANFKDRVETVKYSVLHASVPVDIEDILFEYRVLGHAFPEDEFTKM